MSRMQASFLRSLPAGRDWTEVAVVPPTNEDGNEVAIDCSAMPARFYRVRFEGVALATGSSQEELVIAIAEAVAGGRLGVDA